MLELLFPLFMALALLLPALLIAALMKRLHPGWWRITFVRSLVWSLPTLGLICLAVGQWAPRLGYDPTQTPLAALIVLSMCTQLALLISLPVSGFLARRSKRSGQAPDSGRRHFLRQTAAASVSLAMAGGAATGIANTMNGARVHLKPLHFRNLPNHLNGLRILHLSDLHMGSFMTLPELAATLERAHRLAPHIVLITGDIADDLSLLPATMVMISELNAPLGVFSCLGNHEYHSNINQARDLLAASPGTLLKNFGMPVNWRGGDFFLAGIDDPVGRPLGQDPRSYMRESIDFSLGRRKPWYFNILMSHRPWAFDMTAPRGVELTLAGHTHGGQLGWNGRSVLELGNSARYPWGNYHLGSRQLYTSSGAGQWVPFRLGCPAEAPVLELVRGEAEG